MHLYNCMVIVNIKTATIDLICLWPVENAWEKGFGKNNSAENIFYPDQ